MYVRYFFTGFKTPEMSPAILSLLATLRFLILIIVGSLVQGLVNQFSKGDYSLNFSTIQGFVMPGVTIALAFVLELIRKVTNPAVSISALPSGTVTR